MWITAICITISILSTRQTVSSLKLDLACQYAKNNNNNNNDNNSNNNNNIATSLACQFSSANWQFNLHTGGNGTSTQLPTHFKATLKLSSLSYIDKNRGINCTSEGNENNDMFNCKNTNPIVDSDKLINTTQEATTNKTMMTNEPVVLDPQRNDVFLRVTAASITAAVFLIVIAIGVFVNK